MSSEEDDPIVIASHKRKLLEWITQQDMLKEFSLTKITQHRFKIDAEEMQFIHSFEHVAKLFKVLMYKIGLAYKRQDLFREELEQKIVESQKTSLAGVMNDISCVNQCIQHVSDELTQHTAKQRAFRDVTMQELQTVKEFSQNAVA